MYHARAGAFPDGFAGRRPFSRVAAEAVPLGTRHGGVVAAPCDVDAGEALDFDEAYARHFDFVWRNVRRLGVPEAEVDDAVQEVFLVVHRKLSSYAPRASLKAWIFGVVARVARDHRRLLLRKSPMLRAHDPPI